MNNDRINRSGWQNLLCTLPFCLIFNSYACAANSDTIIVDSGKLNVGHFSLVNNKGRIVAGTYDYTRMQKGENRYLTNQGTPVTSAPTPEHLGQYCVPAGDKSYHDAATMMGLKYHF